MNIFHINKTNLATGITIFMVCSKALSGTIPVSPEPLELKEIMQEMGKNMQLITDGISREDWKLIEETSYLIANHRQPSMGERVKILSFVKADASKFRSHDGETHDSALALGKAAIREDGEAVIADFAVLQNTCLACHQDFRKSIQDHFYGVDKDTPD